MTECKLSKSGNLVAAMAPLGGPSIQALGFRILVLVCVCVLFGSFAGGGGGDSSFSVTQKPPCRFRSS